MKKRFEQRQYLAAVILDYGSDGLGNRNVEVRLFHFVAPKVPTDIDESVILEQISKATGAVALLGFSKDDGEPEVVLPPDVVELPGHKDLELGEDVLRLRLDVPAEDAAKVPPLRLLS
jgi:hypothetical protein